MDKQRPFFWIQEDEIYKVVYSNITFDGDKMTATVYSTDDPGDTDVEIFISGK